jgi:hypothetical protein
MMDQYRYNIAKTKHLISSQYNTSKKEFASFLYDNWTAADESGGDDGDVKRKKGQKDEKNGIRKSLEVNVDTVTAYVAHYVCGATDSTVSQSTHYEECITINNNITRRQSNENLNSTGDTKSRSNMLSQQSITMPRTKLGIPPRIVIMEAVYQRRI